jgi:uncharacterized protein YkwD
VAALLVALLALVLPACSLAVNARASASAGACPGANAVPDGRNAALVDAATLCLMNQLRTARRLPSLRINGALARIASGQANDMVRGHYFADQSLTGQSPRSRVIASGQANDMVRGHYFADQSLTGQSPLSRVIASGYAAHPASMRLLTAQNIGFGTGPHATPAGIVDAWMHSPPHRRIMLTGAYRDVGVGAVASVPYGIASRWLGGTYAVEFGTRGR